MRFSELDGARVGVWGAGREIASFAEQLSRRLPSAQIAVAVFDEEPAEDVRAKLRSPDVQVVSAAEAQRALNGCEVLVRSPGVSIHRPELQALLAQGLPVTTATSLWLAERGGQGVLGVTGTKGKSTTAALAAHVARAGGVTVALAGNIGVPALDLLDLEQQPQVTIVELSSYQIADLESGPQVALLTNLYREHADWHGSEQVYREEKLRLLGLASVQTAVVRPQELELARAQGGLQVLAFGEPDGWHLQGDEIALGGDGKLSLAELPLAGAHNALNLCAALTALEAMDVPIPPLADALADFRALPHRLQPVVERDGVLWVDDSISTTPESALAALASFPDRPLVLIGGGQERGQDYGELARALAQREASVVGVGSTGARLIAAARAAGVPPERAVESSDLDQAVELARGLASDGGAVLLSPAAPSYDNFRDFAERGERFQELVLGLSLLT